MTYHSAEGSTVQLLPGNKPTNWTITLRGRDKPAELSRVRFKDDPPRLLVWRAGAGEPERIPVTA